MNFQQEHLAIVDEQNTFNDRLNTAYNKKRKAGVYPSVSTAILTSIDNLETQYTSLIEKIEHKNNAKYGTLLADIYYDWSVHKHNIQNHYYDRYLSFKNKTDLNQAVNFGEQALETMKRSVERYKALLESNFSQSSSSQKTSSTNTRTPQTDYDTAKKTLATLQDQQNAIKPPTNLVVTIPSDEELADMLLEIQSNTHARQQLEQACASLQQNTVQITTALSQITHLSTTSFSQNEVQQLFANVRDQLNSAQQCLTDSSNALFTTLSSSSDANNSNSENSHHNNQSMFATSTTNSTSASQPYAGSTTQPS